MQNEDTPLISESAKNLPNQNKQTNNDVTLVELYSYKSVDVEVDTNLQKQQHKKYDQYSTALALITLCLCSFTNAFLSISVFPYSGYMVLSWCDPAANSSCSITTENVGYYAGWINSCFMIGRFITSYQWGCIADNQKIGRIGTLQLSLILSAVFSILFGTSRNFFSALLWRTLLGMSNGILSTTKTVANEISRDDDVLERRAMGLVMGMRSWGLLLGPAIGGFLVYPLQQYRGFFDHWFHLYQKDVLPLNLKFLNTFPFLLPNLVGTMLCIACSICVHMFLYETLDTSSARVEQFSIHEDSNDLQHQEDIEAAMDEESRNSKEMSSTFSNGWDKLSTRSHMITTWMFSFVTTMVDEALPLFCMSSTYGLALTAAAIGKVLSGAGLFFAFMQFITFETMTSRFGLYKSMLTGSILGTVPLVFMPLSLVLSKAAMHDDDHQLGSRSYLSWNAFITLSFLVGLSKLMHSLFFTSMAVSINRTVESNQRARMNALILTGNSVVRAISPIFTGVLVSSIFSIKAENVSSLGGNVVPSMILWSLFPVLGLIVAIKTYSLGKQMER